MAYKPRWDVSYWFLYMSFKIPRIKTNRIKILSQPLIVLTSPQRGEMQGSRCYLVKGCAIILKETSGQKLTVIYSRAVIHIHAHTHKHIYIYFWRVSYFILFISLTVLSILRQLRHIYEYRLSIQIHSVVVYIFKLSINNQSIQTFCASFMSWSQ